MSGKPGSFTPEVYSDAELLEGIANRVSVEPGSCYDCNAISKAILSEASKEKPSWPVLVAAVSTGHLSSPRYPAKCDPGLTYVADTIILGQYGLPSTASWGVPWGGGHMIDGHPENYEHCEVCTQWVEAHAYYRSVLLAAGADADALIGESADPLDPDMMPPGIMGYYIKGGFLYQGRPNS